MAGLVSTSGLRALSGPPGRALALLVLLLGALLAPAAQAQPPLRSQFDHLTTGFELLGQHRDLPCESCHANAIFKGTPKDCASCHGVGSQIRATAKPANHILSTKQCDACHTAVTWKPAINFDHTQALGSCSTCHNGVQAQGKPPNHIVTDLECDACHTTLTWSGAVFTHSGVTSGCAACHDGVHADGLAANHFPISASGVSAVPCEACHSTTEFTTFSVATMNHPAAKALPCALCHETAAYLSMHPSTNTQAGDSRPNATLDPNHPKTGDCGTCHDTTSFAASAVKPANHIPTSAPCLQCHSTGDNAVYSVTGVHQGVSSCLSCHGPTVGPFANVTIVTTPANHIPIGSLDCNGSGCHTTTNVNPGGFKLGSASINAPTLSVAGHTTVAAAVSACSNCHESAPYLGMVAGTNTAAGDSRPTATLDSKHPASGDCSGCHTTTPTFANNQTANSKPANHIPTNAACTQCHTTAGNYALYSVTGTHQGVMGCLTCHGPSVATTFANVTIVTTPANHIPTGSLDCNGSGCHTTANVNPGGFNVGMASITAATLNVAGHTTVATAVTACQTCHEAAPYLGMLASTATTAGDSRPTALDPLHPTSGDCSGCHTTTPTFAGDITAGGKPANHIPTSAPCAQCHTTAGNYALYSVTGTHQGVTACLTCHGPTVGPFANVSIVTTPANHMPIGSLDCNGSGCHTTANVGAGGFRLGTASINAPTLAVAGHSAVSGAGIACASCHETAPYVGMLASTATTAGDSRPTALDKSHPTTGDCGNCHVTTPTFATNLLPTATKPAGHIPTTAVCAQCHTTAGNFAVYSVTGVHQNLTGCLSCHAPSVAGTFLNVTIVTTPASHIPIGSLDCNGSGCHTTSNVSPGGFNIGAASIHTPTLTVAGHTTVAGAGGVSGCQTCHETSPYLGMLASTATTAGDSRPTALDKSHPTTGDCNGCHTTTPTFATDQTGNAKPANHIPTSAACAQCHTTAGNYALYSVTGTHQGVTGCLSCHGPSVATSFANVTIVTTPANHIPIGSLDCNGSGCHTTNNVNTGGFRLGAANISTPTLTVAGHTTLATAVTGCQTCHETAPYLGMLASTATTAGDSRPTALDKSHPTSGDCNGCHTTAPTFASDQTGNAKPANHIPTSAACAQCHTTAGNYSVYSVTGTHQGVTGCLTCHGPGVATTFANITIVTTPANHIPIGSLDCNGSGCHTTNNVSTGGFHLGAASLTVPTLTVAGHTTVGGAGGVSGCQTCHETAPYLGMLASMATTAGDSRPTAFDKSHPTSGDCNGCHTTTPTFSTNQTGSSAKPANHIPTNAPCAQCHTTAGNYGLYVMGATGHAGITSNCAQCHAYGLSFYNMAPPTLVEPPSGASGHIPAVPPNGTSSIACELCHSPTAFTTFAGTVMKHAYVTAMKCMSCHEYNMKWKTNSGVELWTRPEPSHHAGLDCGGSGCHTSRDKYVVRRPTVRPTTTATTVAARTGANTTHPTGSQPAASAPPASAAATSVPAPAAPGVTVPFNHATAAGTACITCHTVASGSGKPATHIATSNACQSCHTTLAWLPVRSVDHTQVSGTCASCHNGTIATGKPSSHVATTAACANCHTTNAWTPARFDHAAVVPHSCGTCHDSVHAIGKPRTHIPTTQQCDSCHGTLAWTPVKVDHRGLTVSCAGCHNNVGALGVSPGHMSTRLDCASCHTYPEWSAIHFRHASAAYPGAHRAPLACSSCHSAGTDRVPYPAPADAGSCAGCHAQDFKPAAHPKVVGGPLYSAHELGNCSGACHVYSDTTQSTIKRSLPGPHHRVTDATFRR